MESGSPLKGGVCVALWKLLSANREKEIMGKLRLV
jgi:hypothetical protein